MVVEFVRRVVAGYGPEGEPVELSFSPGDILIFGGESRRPGWIVAVDGSGIPYDVPREAVKITEDLPLPSQRRGAA